MGWLRGTGLKLWGWVVLAAMLFYAVLRGVGIIRQNERLAAANKQLKGAYDADRDIDKADVGTGDPAGDLEWLRQRSRRGAR